MTIRVRLPVCESCDTSDIPACLKRPFILKGYREKPFRSTWGEIFKSLGSSNNETVNIYSHALVAVAFVFVAVLDADFELSRSLFCVGAIIMGSSSAFYHLARHKSEFVYECTYPCDLGGVLLMSMIALAWFVDILFGCHPLMRRVYYSLIYVSHGLVIVTTPLLTRGCTINKDRWHVTKPLFIFLICSGVVPLVHACVLTKLLGPARWAIASTFVAIFIFAIGVVFLFTHWPECRWPGRFDYWGSSHNIWHMLVAAGVAVLYAGLRESKPAC